MAPLPGAPSHDGATLSGRDQAYIQPSALPEHSAVKVQEHDLTLLYQPSQKPIFADVIFVHGLQGHPRKTWESRAGVVASPKPAQKRSLRDKLSESRRFPSPRAHVTLRRLCPARLRSAHPAYAPRRQDLSHRNRQLLTRGPSSQAGGPKRQRTQRFNR
jgi:hypothetical protein